MTLHVAVYPDPSEARLFLAHVLEIDVILCGLGSHQVRKETEDSLATIWSYPDFCYRVARRSCWIRALPLVPYPLRTEGVILRQPYRIEYVWSLQCPWIA